MNIATYENSMKQFNRFLHANKEKIQRLAPKNPIISKDDEWNSEEIWDKHSKELENNEKN